MTDANPASTLRYCENGCTVRSGDRKVRARTQGQSRLCGRCEDQLGKWLAAIPDNYALLPTFIEPGSTEKNPDSKATKASYAALPIRLEVVDLMDRRHGRIWQGTAPAHDRRGVLGTLAAHLERLRDERPLTTGLSEVTVASACDLLDRHRLWISEQDWATDLYEDLKLMNRQLADAVGDYRRPPVGHCHVIPDGTDEPCGGGLYANEYGGVRCSRCGAVWDATHLRQLGLAQAEAQAGGA